jgi:hypothetical protein
MIDNYPAGLIGTENNPQSPFYDVPEDQDQLELDLFDDDEPYVEES